MIVLYQIFYHNIKLSEELILQIQPVLLPLMLGPKT